MAMWTKKWNLWRFFLCSLFVVGVLATLIQDVNADDQEIPSESQCRPYIEKALKDLETGDTHSVSEGVESKEQGDSGSEEETKGEAVDEDSSVEILNEEPTEDGQTEEQQDEPSVEVADEPYVNEAVDDAEGAADDSKEESGEDTNEASDDKENTAESAEDQADTEEGDSNEGGEQQGDSNEASAEENKAEEDDADGSASAEIQEDGKTEESDDKSGESGEDKDTKEDEADDSHERVKRDAEDESSSKEEADDGDSKEGGEAESKEGDDDSKEGGDDSKEGEADSKEDEADTKEDDASKEGDSKEEPDDDSKENDKDSKETTEEDGKDDSIEEEVQKKEVEDVEASKEGDEESNEKTDDKDDSKEGDSKEDAKSEDDSEEKEQGDAPASDEDGEESKEEHPEEDLLMEIDIPENLRSKEHITQILRLDEESTESEILIEKSADIILRELKRLYDNAIKPLEILYKYRDLSNRHFGDPEIFSKPLILFMGPWSGGKSSLINYLTHNEFTEWSLRTGAEPSPAYFNILMHGDEPQVLDGTQLAADWTFSGLQKFGQGLEERLRGLKLPSKLLEKVNIVEIPGILEVRKQVSRVFPFNDACQWFIDRADIIFLVYDPSKLDVGPETEAILDQLKGRESQTRIILNKADQVKPEELMRVQSALIWNISPLMSSAQPPVMYTTSLWSLPYMSGAPARLLQAQERTFLYDLREAIDKRVDSKIASARRFAVRVRNHAKMVDCYLTTYYNHKTIFANKKVVAEAIIEHPQNYHIYEGLSTLTNISRYDLPDPETYRDFFRLNPLYEFQQLSATCTYFRGCPINRLDIAIAYDLPELVGKYKKMVESATPQGMPKS